MPLVSTNWLARHTGMDWRTIKKRIDKLSHDNRGRVDSASALQVIYCGLGAENGEFISTPEAIRRLTIAKEEQVRVQIAQVRENWWPFQEVKGLFLEVCTIVRATLIANENKILSFELINDILRQWRDVFGRYASGVDTDQLDSEHDLFKPNGASGRDQQTGVIEARSAGPDPS